MFQKLFFTLMSLLVLASCGRVIEQNEVALVLESIGNRDSKVINQLESDSTNADSISSTVVADSDSVKNYDLDNFTSKLITATRAPVDVPGRKILIFPLGLQVYKFTKNPSIESPDNEQMVVDAIGGMVKFDLVVHVRIMREAPDLKDRLIKLMKAYQLRNYSGDDDVLAKLVAGRFQKVLRQPFIEYCSNRQALKIIQTKSQMNKYALDSMNKRFNPMGLEFYLVAACSATELPPDQQKKMNEIYLQDVRHHTLSLENLKVIPLEAREDSLIQAGKTDSVQIINEATAAGINLLTKAQDSRGETFVRMLGKKNTVKLETALNMNKALENGKTIIDIVPDGSNIYIRPENWK